MIPLSGLIVFEVIADVFAKEWSLRNFPILFAVLSLLSYLIANTFWLFALKNGSGLARGAVIFSVSTAILATLVGLVFYREQTTTFQLIGMGIGLLSLVFIFWE
jgi:glucose uptake protein GlcU